MASLPVPGGSPNNWASILNGFLLVAHNADGTLANHSAASVQAGNYTASANQVVPVDTTSGSVTITLPTAPENGSQVGVKMVTQGYTSGVPNTVTVAAAGSDVFNKSGGGTTATLRLQSQGVFLEYSGGVWYVISDDLPLGQLDNRYPLFFNVMRYGADATGATDSTTAIQAAQAAAQVAGGTVFFPQGTFQFGTITIPPTVTQAGYLTNQVNFAFCGIGTTILTPNAANTPLFAVGQTGTTVAAGVRFTGGFTVKAHASGSTGAAIDLTGARQFIIESPSYWDSSIGTSSTPGTYKWVIGFGNNAYANRIVDAVCEGQHIGSSFIGVKAVTGIAVNNNTIENPLLEGNTATYMIDAAGSVEMNIYNGIIEGNTVTASIRLGSKTRARGLHFESNVAYAMDSHGTDNADPSSCWLENCVYNSGSGTLAIPSGTPGYNNFIGPLGSLTVTDSGSAPSMLNYGVRFSTNNAFNGELYLPQGGIQLGPYTGMSTSGTVTLSMANGAYQRIALSGNLTLAFMGTAADGQELIIEIVQPASGGPYTVTWNAQFAFGANLPTLNTGASGVSHYVFRYSSSAAAWLPIGRSDATLSSYQATAVTWITATGATGYAIPAGATTIEVMIQAGGEGGGSGALTASGQAGGGGGGGAGGYSSKTFAAADLGGSVTVTVGAGGSGGAAVTSAGSGNSGSSGGTTSFGSFLWAHGGNSGATGGSSTTGGTAGVGGTGVVLGGSAGAGNATTTGGAASVNTPGATGGGGGAGTTGSAAANGGGSLVPNGLGSSSNFGSGGVAGGASPTAGTQPSAKGIPSCGGGGGASAFGSSSAAQNGATAYYGGGGGGGGGCSGGTTSGAGGNGGPGFALIIAHFT